jgi:light-regulated signal transduction histidine kinase (bacteriophytochrome)
MRALGLADEGIMTSAQKLRLVERELAFVRAEYQEYLSAISHDFAGPLRTMSAFSEIIASQNSESFDAETKRHFDFIIAAAADGKRMLDDLRNFSDLLQEHTEFETFVAEDLVRSVLETLTDLSDRPGIDIEIGDLPALTGDRAQMHLVFYHLLKNALQYREESQNTQRTVSSHDHDTSIEFRVSDNGIGVPDTMDERIFQVLKRAVHPDEYPGRGMGLSIARKVIHRHGGSIQLLRDSTTQTVFSFTVSKNPIAI